MLIAVETSSQSAANIPLPEAVGRGEADGVQQAVEPVPAGGQRGPRRVQLLGRRDVDLQDLGLAGELAGGAPGQRQGASRAREHDVRPFLLRQTGHGEGQRGVGEDAGDEKPLAVEESHCARRLCEGRGVHVGILGGTGPAGRGVAVRLADAGVRVTIGSRDAERAATVAAEVVARWPDRDLALGGADNAGAAEADLVVLATPWDSAIATVRPLREPLTGKVVVSMVNALVKEGREMLALIPPRGSMAAAVQAALPREPGVGRLPPPSRPRKWKTSNRGWKLMCSCARTTRRRPWRRSRSSSRCRGCGRSTPGA